MWAFTEQYIYNILRPTEIGFRQQLILRHPTITPEAIIVDNLAPWGYEKYQVLKSDPIGRGDLSGEIRSVLTPHGRQIHIFINLGLIPPITEIENQNV